VVRTEEKRRQLPLTSEACFCDETAGAKGLTPSPGFILLEYESLDGL